MTPEQRTATFGDYTAEVAAAVERAAAGEPVETELTYGRLQMLVEEIAEAADRTQRLYRQRAACFGVLLVAGEPQGKIAETAGLSTAAVGLAVGGQYFRQGRAAG